MTMRPATRHILLAEDSAAEELPVREALREHHANLHARPPLDLLLLDMHLPRKDGDVIPGVLDGHNPIPRGAA
jgi:hypothetical protein